VNEAPIKSSDGAESTVKPLKPEFMPVIEMLRDVANWHPDAVACAVAVFMPSGEMRYYMKATPEQAALAGAHITAVAIQCAAPRIAPSRWF